MQLIDISHVLDETTPIYPGDYKTILSRYATLEKDYYNAYLLQSCLHTGTHLDMPMHLLDDPKTAAEFPLEHFMGKGVLLDVRGEMLIDMKPEYQDLVDENDIVLLYTGFEENYQTDSYFTQHPAVSDTLAQFLISKKIKLLGMDMTSPDAPPFPIHKSLLSAGIFVLENLTNLQSLIGLASFEVMAFPLKISAEASFVRAVCKVE